MQLRFENRRMKCIFMRILDPCAEKLHVSLMQVNYDMEDYNNFPAEPHASMAPPAVAAGQVSNSSSGSTKETRNDSMFNCISIFPQPYFCFSQLDVCFPSMICSFVYQGSCMIILQASSRQVIQRYTSVSYMIEYRHLFLINKNMQYGFV